MFRTKTWYFPQISRLKRKTRKHSVERFNKDEKHMYEHPLSGLGGRFCYQSLLPTKVKIKLFSSLLRDFGKSESFFIKFVTDSFSMKLPL